jgi:hypothetical protein
MVCQQNQKEAIRQNLKDAGCTSDVIEYFMQNYEQDIIPEQIKILSGQRGHLLDDVHASQRKLDCLDYLLYQLKRKADKIGVH